MKKLIIKWSLVALTAVFLFINNYVPLMKEAEVTIASKTVSTGKNVNQDRGISKGKKNIVPGITIYIANQKLRQN